MLQGIELPRLMRFNPRARGGRDFPPVDFIAILATFQSTRPRRARRAQGHASRPAGRVSIHAPAEGATHAPDRTTLIPDGFNPRARGGRDPDALEAYRPDPLVSIHAPAEGATAVAQPFVGRGPVSIHAPAEGATCVCAGGAR